MIGLFSYIQLLYPFAKNREESMGVLTKEEIEDLLSRTLKENEKLRKEIADLTLIAADANAKVKLANDIAVKSQKMFNDLFEIVKTQYDPDFKIDDIQKRLSV